jgi:hypothetical protein
VQWFVDGRKNFVGPRTDVALETLEAVTSQLTSEMGQDTKTVDKRID